LAETLLDGQDQLLDGLDVLGVASQGEVGQREAIPRQHQVLSDVLDGGLFFFTQGFDLLLNRTDSWIVCTRNRCQEGLVSPTMP
jgi:hypothetical protein